MGIVVGVLFEEIGQLFRRQIVLNVQVIVLRRQKIQVQTAQGYIRVPQVKQKQNAQNIRNAVNGKEAGNGAVRVVPVHIVVAQFAGEENDIAVRLAVSVDAVNVCQTVVGIGTESTAEVVVRNDLLNGFLKTERTYDGNGDHERRSFVRILVPV